MGKSIGQRGPGATGQRDPGGASQGGATARLLPCLREVRGISSYRHRLVGSCRERVHGGGGGGSAPTSRLPPGLRPGGKEGLRKGAALLFRLELRGGGCALTSRSPPCLRPGGKEPPRRGGQCPASRLPPGLRPGGIRKGAALPKNLELRRGGGAPPTSRSPPRLRPGGGNNRGEGPRPPPLGKRRNLHVTRRLLSHRGSRVGFVSTPTAGNFFFPEARDASSGRGCVSDHPRISLVSVSRAR